MWWGGGLAPFFVLLLLPVLTLGQGPPFPDVPGDAWYAEAVRAFLADGTLDPGQPLFRPAASAARAEFVKLVVEQNGGILDDPPAIPSFADVPADAWFFPYLEEAAREGWVRGDGDCRGKPRCMARPGDPISRAEAAVLLRRAFGKKSLARAPAFADVPQGSWFAEAIEIAADHCILRGDPGSRRVRPSDPVNRAEMVAMLSRIDAGKTYPDC